MMPTTPFTAARELLKGGWKLLAKNAWRTLAYAMLLASAVLFVKVVYYKHALDRCTAARLADENATRLASSQAQVDNLQHVVAVERRNAQIAEEKQHEIEGQLTAARSAAARYASLHPAPQAHPGLPGAAGVSAAAEPATGPDATAPAAIVPASDLDACAVDYTVAQGWQDWWRTVSQAAQDTDGPSGAKPAG